jgi:H+/Cl- antiporter ClcA
MVCGLVSFGFSQTAKLVKDLFDGHIGPQLLCKVVKSLPYFLKPMVGGLLCSLIVIPYLQIIFFSYKTLNVLFHSFLDDSLPFIFSFIVVKTIAAALAASSGLVGGTFAPSLFLGTMMGAGFHQVVGKVLELDMTGRLRVMEIADSPAYMWQASSWHPFMHP